MNRLYRCLSVLMILVISAGLCSFSRPSLNVVTDTEKNHVYRYVTADDVIGSPDQYKDQYVLVSGKLGNDVSSNNSFNIKTTDKRSLRCSVVDGINVDLSHYRFNEDVIAVYGRVAFSYDVFSQSTGVYIKDVEKVIPCPIATAVDMYYTLDGGAFNREAALERTLNNGGVRYYIPFGWDKIEHDIQKEDLGTIEGRQYDLGKLDGSDVPETLFVCYFDKKLLSNSAYITKEEKVQKAIINNITGSPGNPYRPNVLFPNYYGVKYTYYLSKYSDPFDMKGYHAEYVFLPDGGNGMVMFLYVYRDAEHLSDVLMIMRFLTA